MPNSRKHYCWIVKFSGYKLRPNAWNKLCHLIRSLTTVSSKHPYTRRLFRSINSIENERSRHVNSEEWCTIHPYSMACYAWEVLMMFIYVILVGSNIIILAAAVVIWDDEIKHLHLSNVGELRHRFHYLIVLVDFLSLMNILIIFFTGYEKEFKVTSISDMALRTETSHCIVLGQRQIAVRYLKSFFFIDAIATLELFIQLMKPLRDFLFPYEVYRYRRVLYLLLRLARLATAVKTLRMLFDQFFKNPMMFSMVIYCISSVFFIWTFACLHICAPDVILHLTGQDKKSYLNQIIDTYMMIERHVDFDIIFAHSILIATSCCLGNRCLYESFDLNTISVENISFYLNSLAGFALRAWFYIVSIRFLTYKYKSWMDYECFLKETEIYMIQNQSYSQCSHRRVLEYIKNTLNQQIFDENKTLLNCFERRFQYEIFAKSSMDLLKKCYLFKGVPYHVLSKLIFHLKFETYVAGQYIFRMDDYADCVYFIACGTVAAYERRGLELCHMSDGEYFGELGLVSHDSRRRADVVAIDLTQLYRLNSEDFFAVTGNGELYEKIRRNSAWRLSKIEAKVSKAFVP